MMRDVATIYDVAKRAKVSTYTVSAVVNKSAKVSPELTKRVLTAVQELDYTVNDLARGLQTRRTRTIGMLIPDIANPFYANVVRGVEDSLRKAGYSLILGSTYNRSDEQDRYIGVLRSKQVDGTLLFIAAGDESGPLRLIEQQKPVVFIGRAPRTFEADVVLADNKKGVAMATEHLVAKGHLRIGIVAGQAGLTATEERIAGWRKALKKHKLKAPNEYVGDGDWTAQGARGVAAKMLDLAEPPTAIMAMNFLMMTGVLAVLKERGIRCPGQVEVMSSDDSEWLDVFEPSISTIVQPSYELGTRSAELLLARMADPDKAFERVTLQPKLHIRGTYAIAVNGL